MDDAANELLSLAGNIEFEEDELARRESMARTTTLGAGLTNAL